MSMEFEGNVGSADGAVVYSSKQDLSDYPEHIIQCTVGTLNVLVSLDGSNFVAVAVDDMTVAPMVQVLTVAAGKVVRLRMRVRAIRLTQNGTTASNGRILHSEGS